MTTALSLRAVLAGALFLLSPPIIAALPELSQVEQVSAGDGHACAVTSLGAVYCWGDNRHGQLGDGTEIQRPLPAKIVGLTKPVQAVAAGRLHSCALTRDGEVYCWGSNSSRAIGDGTGTDRLTPVRVPALGTGTAAITAGGDHTCAVDRQGAVRCWGGNFRGQVGTGELREVYSTPAPVVGLSGAVQRIAAGSEHTCALYRSGELVCWGALGSPFGQQTIFRAPSALPGLDGRYRSLDGGGGFACVVSEGGGAFCHGSNSNGRLGNPAAPGGGAIVTTPVQGLSSGVETIAAGDAHGCALLQDGSLRCWGLNSAPGASVRTGGQLGDGTRIDRPFPAPVSALDGPLQQVSLGQDYSCAVTSVGTVRCWGGGFFDEAGDGVGVERRTPRDVSGAQRFGKLAIGDHHSCGIDAAGAVYCWGRNHLGQLGDGSTADRGAPTRVADLAGRWVAVTAGDDHSCAVSETGEARCWGNNSSGELGDGTTTPRLRPTPVLGLAAGVVEISAGASHSCARLGTSEVRCWGGNASGQLGDGTLQSRLTPTSVAGLAAPVVSLRAGAFHTCAIAAGTRLSCWGDNGSGQIGNGFTDDRVSPTGVTAVGNVQAVAAGGFHTCALLANGEVRCWGDNLFGSLAIGSNERTVPTPAPVIGLSGGVQAIEAGSNSTCALSPGGALTCWGNHPSIGDGSDLARATPVAISGLGSGVAHLPAGAFRHNCVAMVDGRAKCWGDGTFGQVGDGGRDITLPAPVRVDEAQAQIREAAGAVSGPPLFDGFGKYVVYATSAPTGSDDGNAAVDVVRAPRDGSARVRVSVADDESEIDGASIEPTITADGEHIAFVAADAAVGKLAGESAKQAHTRRKNEGFGIFLRNMLTGTTRRIANALPAGIGTKPAFAPGGRSIAFTGLPPIGAGAPGQPNVFVLRLDRVGEELVPGASQCASCKAGSADSDGNSSNPVLSADGNWLAFQTAASNLATGLPSCGPNRTSILLRNMTTGQSRVISAGAAGVACSATGSSRPSIDWAGSRVAFQSDTAIDPADRNGTSDVYVYDAGRNVAQRVSVDPQTGHDGLGVSAVATISGNGELVVFQSAARNIESSEPDSNEATDVFAVNLDSGALRRASRSAIGQLADADSVNPGVDYAGKDIAFSTAARNLFAAQPGGATAVPRMVLTGTAVASINKTATWWTPSESGWGLSTIDQGDAIALGWFTYDLDGEPTWFVGAATPRPDGSYAGTVFRSTGVPLQQISGDATRTSSAAADVTLKFSGSGGLQFAYSLEGGGQQSKAMRRFVFGEQDITCQESPSASRASVSNLSDVWWGGAATPGWGVFLTQVADTLYAFWYTYDSDGEAVFFIAVAPRQGDGSYRGELFRQANGVPFTQIDRAPPSAGATAVGTARFMPLDGDAIDFTYGLGGVTQTKRIRRFVFGARAGQCAG